MHMQAIVPKTCTHAACLLCLFARALMWKIIRKMTACACRYRITPSVFAQAGVIFTIFHLYAYLGMALYGGVITSDGDYGVSLSINKSKGVFQKLKRSLFHPFITRIFWNFFDEVWVGLLSVCHTSYI